MLAYHTYAHTHSGSIVTNRVLASSHTENRCARLPTSDSCISVFEEEHHS